MKSLLSSEPVLWFFFLFNAAVAAAVATGVGGLDATQQITTSVAMGVVAC